MKTPWFIHIGHYRLQYAAVLASIFLGIGPALALIILLSYAIKQLNTPPALVPWPELLGEHASRWLRPFVRGTAFQDGLSIEFQAQWFVTILLVMAFANWVFKFVQEYLAEDLGEKISRDLRFSIFQKWCALNFRDAQAVDAGLLASMVGDDSREIRQSFSRIWGSMIAESLNALVFIAWLVILDTQLFILFVFILLPAGIVLRVAGKSLKRLSRQGLNQQSDMLGLILERLRGWQSIRTHKALNFEMKKFNETNKSLFHVWRRAARAKAASAPVVEWLGVIAAACVIIVALKRIAEDALTSQVLTAFLVTVGFLSNSIQSLTSQTQGTKKASVALKRIHLFLQENPRKYEQELLPDRNSNFPEDAHFNFKVQNLTAVLPSNHKLFENVSLEIQTGDVCAIVGPSGSGKSTFLKILLGLENPQNGTILLNGEVISESFFEKISKSITFIAQEPFLISGTVADNIAYPNQFNHSMEQKILESLDAVNLKKPLNESVLGLSGGERQRLMFARGLFHNAQIWVIDEATSALDATNEELVLKKLLKNRTNRLIIAVTHRKKILEDANVILNLGN